MSKKVIKKVQKSSPASKQVGGDHYTNERIVIQPIVYCELNKMSPLESKIVKYVTRAPDKHGLIDLQKARHCLDMLIDLRYGTKEIVKETMIKMQQFLDENEDDN